LILPQDTQSQTLDDPFQPLVEELKRLEQDDPQYVQPAAAQMATLFSTLCESYSAKKAHNQQLERENEALRAINIYLCQERESLERRHANQEASLVYFEQAFENVRRGIFNVLKDWESCSPELISERDSIETDDGDPQLA
jgi:RecB family exonuclease